MARIITTLTSAVLVLLCAELLAVALEPVLPERSVWPTVETELKVDQLRSSERFDVVFLGSSITEAAIDPGRLETVNSYNAALPFSSPVTNLHWYREVFAPGKAKIVLLGVFALPYQRPVQNEVLTDGIQTASHSRPSWTHRLALGRLTGVGADWNELTARNQALASNLWTDLGHQTVYYDMVSKPFSPTPVIQPGLSRQEVDAITELDRLITSHDGELILMIEPGRFRHDVPENLHARHIANVAAIADDLDIPLLDTFGQGWCDDLFVDEFHFNETGTRLFTSMLQRALQGWLDQREGWQDDFWSGSAGRIEVGDYESSRYCHE